MILVNAYLCPKGDIGNARLLGSLEIANDATGTQTVGNYTGTLRAEYTPKNGPGRKAAVQGFNRKTQSVWTLIGAFLKTWGHTKHPAKHCQELPTIRSATCRKERHRRA